MGFPDVVMKGMSLPTKHWKVSCLVCNLIKLCSKKCWAAITVCAANATVHLNEERRYRSIRTHGMKRTIGFWRSWSLVVGTMIGSGIFLLPSVLAPYGSLSIIGWVVTALGTLLIALTLGSLSSQIDKDGGPYAFAHEVLGPLFGFLIGWGLWVSFWVSIAATSVAFAGYASTLIPAIEHDGVLRTLISLLMIWTLAIIFYFGMRGVGLTQIITTLGKLVPLLLIPALGFILGEQPINVSLVDVVSEDSFSTISKVVLITMWAFLGIEVATIPAKDTINPKRTIPRAIVFGLLAVTVVYVFATLGLWSLIPVETLSQSPSPFADAADVIFGPIGATFVAVGVMISIIGSVNGCFVGTVILPQSMADDGIAPSLFTDKNQHGIAWKSLLIAVALITLVLLMNMSSRLVGVFELLIILSTLTSLLPYAVSALADLVLQLRFSEKPISKLSFLRAIGALVFSIFVILGAGLETIIYGAVLLVAGLLLYFIFVPKLAKPASILK